MQDVRQGHGRVHLLQNLLLVIDEEGSIEEGVPRVLDRIICLGWGVRIEEEVSSAPYDV